jgi:hypothetical protein
VVRFLQFLQICNFRRAYLADRRPRSVDTLIKALKPAIIDPAIQKHNELRLIKAREPKIRSAEDFIEGKGVKTRI